MKSILKTESSLIHIVGLKKVTHVEDNSTYTPCIKILFFQISLIFNYNPRWMGKVECEVVKDELDEHFRMFCI
jgi:hypothetical protein